MFEHPKFPLSHLEEILDQLLISFQVSLTVEENYGSDIQELLNLKGGEIL
jgi:hypothetical protein